VTLLCSRTLVSSTKLFQRLDEYDLYSAYAINPFFNFDLVFAVRFPLLDYEILMH